MDAAGGRAGPPATTTDRSLASKRASDYLNTFYENAPDEALQLAQSIYQSGGQDRDAPMTAFVIIALLIIIGLQGIILLGLCEIREMLLRLGDNRDVAE